jgi:hypothetical protein
MVSDGDARGRVQAQKGLIRQSMELVKKAEEMGVWEPIKHPEGTQVLAPL